MSVINVLSKQISELIAAGEVIERPASVIKELVENSIDAHASSVTVEIKNGGTTFMRVTDNGCGISHEDVKKAFFRHATSKISKQDDLDSIATLGFRGEALASICAVSKVELITKSENEENGTYYCLDGGEEKEFRETGCPQGTTFIVRDLFYNVPARMKFLKKDVSEANNISSLIDRMALSHPEVSFTYIRDGRQVLKTSGNGDLKTAVFQVFGKQFTSSLIPVEYEHSGIRMSGYITTPVNSNRAGKSMQLFFVNGRYVRTKTAMAAIEQAYKGYIMTGKYPACVLMLDMDCSTLDVNVHPAKLEIRFTNERPVYECVYYGVRTVLSDYDTRNTSAVTNTFVPTNPAVLGRTSERGTQLGFSYGSPEKQNDEPEVFVPDKRCYATVNDPCTVPVSELSTVKIRQINLSDYLSSNKKTDSKELFSVHSDTVSPNAGKVLSSPETDRLVSVTAAECDKAPELIPVLSVQSDFVSDKSASLERNSVEEQDIPESNVQESPQNEQVPRYHETVALVDEDDRRIPPKYVGEVFSAYIIIEYGDGRLMFIDKHAAHERLIYEKLKRQYKKSDPQLLLEPVAVTLDKNEYLAVIENKEMLLDAGFDVEDFGGGTILIRSVPLFLEKLEISEAFLEIAAYLKTHKKIILSEKMEWIFQNTACRAAIKAGNKNKPEELIELAEELERNPDVRYCPHGRPIYFFMTKSDLEKNFKRI